MSLFASLAVALVAAPFGASSAAQPLRVERLGDPLAPRRLLVVGCIHGDECAGSAVTRALLRECPPGDVDLWLMHNLNPDGRRIGTRLNARGVDLNRNFGFDWRPIGNPWNPEYSGPRPFSEPETRAARSLIDTFRPDVTVWFHQQAEPLVRAWGQSVPAARTYANAARLRFVKLPWMDGTAPNWQNHTFAGTASFVVELPLGKLSARAVAEHVDAIHRVARAP